MQTAVGHESVDPRLIKFFIRIIIIAMEASVGSNKTLGKGRGARFRHLYKASR